MDGLDYELARQRARSLSHIQRARIMVSAAILAAFVIVAVAASIVTRLL